MSLQLTKIEVNNNEFKDLLDSNFDLGLEYNWEENKKVYGKMEYMQNNKMFITQIYYKNVLVWDIDEKQKAEYDQYTSFINQELNEKRKISWKLKKCPSCHTFKKNNLIDTSYEDNCDNCKLYLDMVEDYEKLEDQEIEHRDYILKTEYYDNLRKLEPNKNKYCVKKFVTHNEYDYYDEKQDKSIYKKSRYQVYKFKCGREYPTNLNTLKDVTDNHLTIEKCNVCRILTGESKRKTGLKQDEISLLFSLGLTGYSSGTKNVESTQKTLEHYSTIECIRTINNVIIDNSQCWSSGFASCPRSYGKYDLPLTTLQRLSFDIYSIKILDKKDSDLLFMLVSNNDKMHHILLYGRDDNQNFLVELDNRDPYNPNNKIQIKNIKQAYKSMRPIEALNKKNVIRQGDLFFIPIKPITIRGKKIKMLEKFLDYQKAEYIPIEVKTDRYLSSTETEKLEREYDKLNVYHGYRYYWDPFKDATTKILADNIKREFVNKTDPHKRLVRCQIFDTNHEASEMCTSKNKKYTYVRGMIYHRNRQHQKLKLEVWHMVLRNRVKQGFVIERFGGYGGD